MAAVFARRTDNRWHPGRGRGFEVCEVGCHLQVGLKCGRLEHGPVGGEEEAGDNWSCGSQWAGVCSLLFSRTVALPVPGDSQSL